MANLVRRQRHESDLAPIPYSLDPFETMRRLMAWDPFRTMSAWPGDATSTFAPAFELRETADAFVIEADLPGLEEKNVDVELAGNRLTIRGTRDHEERHEEGSYHTYERSYGSFARSFTVPEGTDMDGIDAHMENGVLRIQIPKRPEVQPRKIKVGKPVSRLVDKVKGILGVGESAPKNGDQRTS